MKKKYKYKISFSGHCAEAVHGTITQKQAHFWKKNFGTDYNDVVHYYVQFNADEVDMSGLIPEEYQIGQWYEKDKVDHINAPYWDGHVMDVEDEDGNFKSYHLDEMIDWCNANTVVKNTKKPTADSPVHFYSYSHEKGGFLCETKLFILKN